MNIVIPMAGLGSRFSVAGYVKPKPFIDVQGVPMIIRVLENIKTRNCKFILVANNLHLQNESEIIKRIKGEYSADVIGINGLTEGTACTILHARALINNESPLLIANSDQLVDIDINNFIDDCTQNNCDGSILVFNEESRNPKWSYAKLDKNQKVVLVREKEAISTLATVGIYYYSQGNYFVNGAIDMIANKDKTNSEYYTCPTYNYMIREGLKVKVYRIPKLSMHALGTPEDLNIYLNLKK
jgi:NDP-sugar pyrophosphorylase family protein